MSKFLFLVLMLLVFHKASAQSIVTLKDSLKRKQGEWVEFHKNSNKPKVIRYYVDGMIHGPESTFTKNGTLQAINFFSHGHYLFYKTYHTKGKKIGRLKSVHGSKGDRTISNL